MQNINILLTGKLPAYFVESVLFISNELESAQLFNKVPLLC